jgi:hypothetical protein
MTRRACFTSRLRHCATGQEEEAKAALHRVSELHTTSLEVDRKMHEARVTGAR